MNDRHVFADAGVSLEEANAAKEDLLGRVHDFLGPDEEDIPGRLAQLQERISQFMDPNIPIFDLSLEQRHGAVAVAMAALSQSTAAIPGMALSLHDMAEMTGLPLEMLEQAYFTQIRPDLAPQDAAPQIGKDKKRSSRKRKKGR